MKKKNLILLGLQVFYLAMVFVLAGCYMLPSSREPMYHNFGNVSEENFALIHVMPISFSTNNLEGSTTSVVLNSINGHEGWREWEHPTSIQANVFVKIAPGIHTFTHTFYPIAEERQNQKRISVTYNVEAGKGYWFRYSVSNRVATLTLNEYANDENGEIIFSGFMAERNSIVVAEQSMNF
jgi:hypothetical protein